MNKSCLNCVYKHVCLKRQLTVFLLYTQTGRYEEAKDATENVDVSGDCENYEEATK